MKRWPSTRHDGSAFRASDAKRRRRAGQQLPIKALLVQITGDWTAFKDVFQFPCRTHQRMTHWVVLGRMVRQGRSVTPISEAAGVKVTFSRSFLVGATLCASRSSGNVCKRFTAASCVTARSTSSQRVCCHHVTDTENEVLWCRVSWPRASGAPTPKVFWIQPTRWTAVRKRPQTPSRAATVVCPSTRPLPRNVLATHRRKFCALKVALEARRPDIFRAKPKLHLFQELCEHDESGRPAAHRTYREEEFGGSMVAMARRRRKAHTAPSVALQVLKFSARLKVPNFERRTC